jgi:hypothetical protein
MTKVTLDVRPRANSEDTVDIHSVAASIPPESAWRRSRRCESVTCVEVAHIDDDVAMRDGKHPDGDVLRFGREAWAEFVAGVRAGEFD